VRGRACLVHLIVTGVVIPPSIYYKIVIFCITKTKAAMEDKERSECQQHTELPGESKTVETVGWVHFITAAATRHDVSRLTPS